MSVNDSGPAFPIRTIQHEDGGSEGYLGMSLRQYYAAKAMQAMIPRTEAAGDAMIQGIFKQCGITEMSVAKMDDGGPDIKALENQVASSWTDMFDVLAERSFAAADAMIRYEEKGGT